MAWVCWLGEGRDPMGTTDERHHHGSFFYFLLFFSCHCCRLSTRRQARRARRLGPFPSQSTERFSATRGKVDRAALPKGPNGRALCRLCQVGVGIYERGGGECGCVRERGRYVCVCVSKCLCGRRHAPPTRPAVLGSHGSSHPPFHTHPPPLPPLPTHQTECPKKANTFCSKACVHEHRLRTDGSYVRKCLLVRRETHARKACKAWMDG